MILRTGFFPILCLKIIMHTMKKKAPLDQIDCENIKSTYIDILTNRKSAFWEIMLNIDNEAYLADFENWVFDCG